MLGGASWLDVWVNQCTQLVRKIRGEGVHWINLAYPVLFKRLEEVREESEKEQLWIRFGISLIWFQLTLSAEHAETINEEAMVVTLEREKFMR